MTLTIPLPREEQQKLAARAAAAGRDVTAYVCELIRKDLEDVPSIVEAAAPIATAVAASGVSDEQFDTFIEQSRQEAWDERHPKPMSAP